MKEAGNECDMFLSLFTLPEDANMYKIPPEDSLPIHTRKLKLSWRMLV